MYRSNGIPTERSIVDIKEGWVNKPKGALQILYKCRWINPALQPNDYTWKGKRDQYGNRIQENSIKRMISTQPDFLQQKTILQHYCKELGALSNRTPDAHCKIAGEGIKFDWGFSKMMYRSKPMSEKQNKSKFHKLVKSVLSSTTLTLSVCRSSAHRARQYMLAYMALAEMTKRQESHTQHTNNNTPHTTKTSIKQTRGHKTKHKHGNTLTY